MMQNAALLATRSAAPVRIPAVTTAIRPQAELTPGVLVGRPDLGEEQVLAAIADRLSFEGVDPSKAPVVLRAARAGKPVARAFLRRLVLPAPRSSLSMPIQRLLKGEPVVDAHGAPHLAPQGR